jgi:hypothetical protein
MGARREPSFDAEPRAVDAAPRRQRRSVLSVVVAVVVIASVAAGWYWLSRPEVAPEVTPVSSLPRPTEEAAQVPKGQTSTPLPAPDKELVQASGIHEALVALFGSEAVLRFLATTDFPRRAVATLDSLGRDHAPVAAWPVLPAPGRFLVDHAGGSQFISEGNSLRYEPFVAFVAAVDAARAVELYRRMYPLLDQAYRGLGFGGRSLNDRVFEVIDLLLATPEPSKPLEVSLTQVKGPIPSANPWTRYEYADDNLQRLTAGQKILLRVGPENRKHLKEKLQELRAELLQVSVAAPARP